MDELHSRWASPPQAAFCAAVNAAAGSEANDIRASPKKAMIAIVARFSDILFPRFVVETVSLSHAWIGKALGSGLAGMKAEEDWR
jgi:hypothetical protein